MPRGTVHDDGGDQLHGRGIGTIRVTHYSDDEKDPLPNGFVVYLPFRNQGPRVEIGDIVIFQVGTGRCNRLGGDIRLAFNILVFSKIGKDAGTAREVRRRLEGLDH